MNNLEKLREHIKSRVVADIFNAWGSEEKSNKLLQQIQSQSDDFLDAQAKYHGVPDYQIHIYRALVRGQDNDFIKELALVDGLLQTGDIILMTGLNSGAELLVKLQKKLYKQARSSHVALVHADFICVDAMPKLGTSNRVINEVLSNVDKNWKVIRCSKVQPKDREILARACAFYLAQPYKIKPSIKSLKDFSYCSELARKVYNLSDIKSVGIPQTPIIMPADFDKIIDNAHPQWLDVTEIVRPAIDFCNKYPVLIDFTSRLFIEGLKLNRKRFEERTAQISKIQKDIKDGKITRKEGMSLIRSIREIEESMNHSFWNISR